METLPLPEKFPSIVAACEDCNKAFTGQIGPIDSSYNLVEKVYPWVDGKIHRQLITHHSTNRFVSRGHNSFIVTLDGEFVGKIKMSSNTQRFQSANPNQSE